MKFLITLLLAAGIVFSVYRRTRSGSWRTAASRTPLASALSQLVGTAGGIYLSLELLFTFLGVPERYWNPPDFIYWKPLALWALIIAILQPYVLMLWAKRKGGGTV